MTLEPLTRLLARLPDAAPNPDRAAKIRARCHAALARRQPHRVQHPRRVESLCVVGFCVAYLISVIQYALQ